MSVDTKIGGKHYEKIILRYIAVWYLFIALYHLIAGIYHINEVETFWLPVAKKHYNCGYMPIWIEFLKFYLNEVSHYGLFFVFSYLSIFLIAIKNSTKYLLAPVVFSSLIALTASYFTIAEIVRGELLGGLIVFFWCFYFD